MRRHGGILIEASVAAGLVATAMIAVAQLLAVTAHQERALEQRRVASQEAANALERVGSLSWSEIRDDRFPEVTLSAAGLRRLPAGKLAVRLELLDGPPQGKQISSQVSWRNRAGGMESVRLSVWRFSAEPTP